MSGAFYRPRAGARHDRDARQYTVDDLAEVVHPDAAVFWDRDVAPYIGCSMDHRPTLYLERDTGVPDWLVTPLLDLAPGTTCAVVFSQGATGMRFAMLVAVWVPVLSERPEGTGYWKLFEIPVE